MTDERQPIVWIINDGGHDYSKAEVHGRMVPMTTGGINPFSPDRLMVNLASRLRNATEEDFAIVGGSPMLNGIVMSMWLERFDKMKCLVWSNKKERYEIVTVTKGAIVKNATSTGSPAP